MTTPPPLVGLTEQEKTTITFCEFLTTRIGIKHTMGWSEPVRPRSGPRRVIIFVGEYEYPPEIPNIFDSHDSLQKVIDVMTPEELERMFQRLITLWSKLPDEHDLDMWLLKRDLPAHVAAALVAIQGGEGDNAK